MYRHVCGGGSVCVSGDGTLKGSTYPREPPPPTELSVYKPSDTSLRDSDHFCPVYLMAGGWPVSLERSIRCLSEKLP